jgi:hypothetical protein
MSRLSSMVLLAFTVAVAAAQSPPRTTNIDERQVGTYVLPEVLRLQDGRPVSDSAMWQRERRPELLDLFAAHQFGRTPTRTVEPRVDVIERAATGLGGLARRTQVRLVFGEGPDAPIIRLVLYTPATTAGPVPALLYLGFAPNAVAFPESGLEEGVGWDLKAKTRIPANQARVPVGFDARPFLQSGFAVAHVYYCDIEPDFDGGAALGVRSLFGGDQARRQPDEWGAIGAWSWGLSRILDYLRKEPGVVAGKIALAGASRLGKTTLWAAAQDTRVALVMPLISGEGGAALSRRHFGETVADLTDPARYHYWFAPRYRDYAGRVAELPVDSHMLLALIAPRPMLLVNGDSDTWSDWRGEILAADAARPVYALLGRPDDLAVVTHKGGHTLLPEDLAAMAAFMTKHFGRGRP